MERKYGLTCDNVLSFDMVTAEGQLVTASDTENSDLFWGLRGGGGNFGIVTSFEYQLHTRPRIALPIPRNVLGTQANEEQMVSTHMILPIGVSP